MTALDARLYAGPPPTTPPTSGGATVWLTGLPSAGKTTLATALSQRLDGRPVELLDGDETGDRNVRVGPDLTIREARDDDGAAFSLAVDACSDHARHVRSLLARSHADA